MAKKNKKIIRLRTYKFINIGTIIFAFILLYLIISVVMYLSKERIQIYTVSEGSLAVNSDYTGIILRDETVYNTEYNGTVYYYMQEGQKTGVGDLDVSASLGVADLSTGVGDLELKLAPPAEKADLTAGTGDVTLEITGNQSDYSWQLSTGTGDIRLNGEIMSPFLLTGGDGDGTLSLTSGTGDVSLEFQ